MTRREFLRRSAPMVAAGLVTPWFVEAVMRWLFPPKKYWDMGKAHQLSYGAMLEFKWSHFIEGVEDPFTRRVMAMLYEDQYENMLKSFGRVEPLLVNGKIPLLGKGGFSDQA